MLVAFSGLKGSGKDTAAKVLVDEYGFTKVAFADALRDALYVLDPYVAVDWSMDKPIRVTELIQLHGYEKAKRGSQEFRRLMQVFGTEVGRQLLGENVWVDILKKRFPDLARSHTKYVPTDCRFDNEAIFVHDNNGTIVWITRPGVVSDGHASESEEVKAYADYLISNESTIAELEEDVRMLAHLRGFERIEREA